MKGMRLKDKVALITGAGSGIGQETALLFAREGAAVVAVDVNEQAAREAAETVRKDGARAFAVRADVSKAPDCEEMIAAARTRVRQADVLFNNAGIMHGEGRRRDHHRRGHLGPHDEHQR